MKYLISALLTVVVCFSPMVADAQTPSRDSLMTMLKASGAVDMLYPMIDAITQKANEDIKKKAPGLSPEAQNAFMDELKSSVDIMIVEILAFQMDYYAKHLTQEDVDSLIAIYNSPAWKKNIEVGTKFVKEEYGIFLKTRLPQMTQEMMQRIFTRLKEEGFMDDKEDGA